MHSRKIVFLILLIFIFSSCGNIFASTEEERLQKELDRINKEIAETESELYTRRQESASIERDVAILSAEIKKAKLRIDALNASIGRLGSDIKLKENTVNELDQKMDRSKESLEGVVRQKFQIEQTSLIETLLSGYDISDFFLGLDQHRFVEGATNNLFEVIRENKSELQEEKQELTVQREKELDVKAQIEAQKRIVDQKEAEKKNLLALSKQVEAGYETILANKQQRAQEIRNALFKLRDSDGIPFEQALEYAKKASAKTGVRPAFILAILQQESDLGKNVGTCNRAGDPPEKSWQVIMPGPNDGNRSYRDDQTIFLEITNKLGLDPDTTPLSCPWGGGWGGAMGPSQFIPTTWKAYAPRVEATLNVKTANPWNPEHAFMATAIYVADLGAAGGSYTAERTAALKYYAGSNWSLPQNAFYGNGVMKNAEGFQKNIDFLDSL